MKKLALVLAVFMLFFDSCSKCKSINLGTINLMPESLILLNKLKGKTLILKDSLGALIRFRNNSGMEEETLKISTKQICTTAFGGGFEFFDAPSKFLNFTSSDIDMNMRLQTFIDSEPSVSNPNDTLLYDVLSCQLNGPKLTATATFLELSNRGTAKPIKSTGVKLLDSITLLNKPFKNVALVKNDLKNQTIEPSEMYVNATQGVVAIRLLDGRLFVLDKIE
jgi:hypothetical protein